MRIDARSPLFEAVADLRDGILQTWVHDAVEAYVQASALLGWPGETQRLRQARVGLLQTAALVPAYEELLARHGERTGWGRQMPLPWEPHAEQLRRRWCGHAFAFVREAGPVPVQRWVLQASVGLSGPVDRQTAADLLVAAAADRAAWQVAVAP